jgi:hypothetical protein
MEPNELAESPPEPIAQEGNLPEETPDVPETGEPTTASDPFEELLQQEIPAFNTSPEGEEPVETDVEPKQDPNQHQYWQSQYDKVKGEFDNLNSKYKEMESLEPIAKYIQQNPRVLDNVQQSLPGGQQAGQAPVQEPPPEPPQRPDRPTKPAEYDAIDAYSDPNSTSYKYRDSVDTYRDGMIEFQEKRNELMEDALRNEAGKQQQAMAHQQQVQQVHGIQTQLTNGYGFSNEDAQQFIKEMAKPESISMDNLVTLWKMKQAPSGEVIANQRKVEEMQRQKEKLSIPNTVGVAPAETPQETSVEDGVMNALIDDFKSQNPF